MLALGIGLGICALNGGRGFTALIAALLVAWLLLSAAQKRLGGVTGDVFGCLIELTESAVLVACWPAVRHTEGGFPTGSVQPPGWSPASESIDNPVLWISTSVF